MDQLGLMAALGYLLQWAKAPKKFPTWAAYAIVGGLAAAAWLWQSPGVESLCVKDWRACLSSFGTFVLGIEGVSAFSRKAGAAPKTNSWPQVPTLNSGGK